MQDAEEAKRKAEQDARAKPAPVKHESGTSGSNARGGGQGKDPISVDSSEDETPAMQDPGFNTPNSKDSRRHAAQRTPTAMNAISRDPTDKDLTDHMKKLQAQAREAIEAKGAQTTERKHGLFSHKVPNTKPALVERSAEGFLVRRPPLRCLARRYAAR